MLNRDCQHCQLSKLITRSSSAEASHTILEALRLVAVGADDILRQEGDTSNEAKLKLCHAKAESQQRRCVVRNFVRWLMVQDLTAPSFRSASVRTRWQHLRRKKRAADVHCCDCCRSQVVMGIALSSEQPQGSIPENKEMIVAFLHFDCGCFASGRLCITFFYSSSQGKLSGNMLDSQHLKGLPQLSQSISMCLKYLKVS